MSPYDDDDDADDHPQRKRRRSLSSACDDIEEQPSAKRRKKAGIVDDNNNNNYPPEFWDALSKITLTRRALKEFDRRTAVEKSAVEKSAPELLAAAAVEERSTRRLLRSDTMKLRRFAQNGGPNLNSLRGVSMPHIFAHRSILMMTTAVLCPFPTCRQYEHIKLATGQTYTRL